MTQYQSNMRKHLKQGWRLDAIYEQCTMNYKLLTLLCLLCLSMVVATTPVLAAGKAHITLNPTMGPPTTQITVQGTGFHPDKQVTLLFARQQFGSTMADDNGAFTAMITVPNSAPPGSTPVEAKQGGLSAHAPFTVWTNWNMFGNDPQQSHENPYENRLNPSNVGNLTTDWAFTTRQNIYASPAQANGLVYIDSGQSLYAINATNGALRWKKHIEFAYSSSPAYDNGIVYIGVELSVEAFNATSGTLLWTAAVGGILGTAYSSPVVANGVVYIGSDDDKLYAFNASTGASLWTATTGGQITSTPAFANGMVYVNSEDDSVYAFDATTGVQLWKFTTGSYFFASPAIVNGIVYVSSYDGHVYALDASTGVVIWIATIGSKDVAASSPAVANGAVYVGANNTLYAFNASTGAQLWMDATGSDIFSSPAVANGVVYVGSDDDKVSAFDATDGSMLWDAITGSYIRSSPAVANGVVYVGSGDHKLYAYHLPGTSP